MSGAPTALACLTSSAGSFSPPSTTRLSLHTTGFFDGGVRFLQLTATVVLGDRPPLGQTPQTLMSKKPVVKGKIRHSAGVQMPAHHGLRPGGDHQTGFGPAAAHPAGIQLDLRGFAA